MFLTPSADKATHHRHEGDHARARRFLGLLCSTFQTNYGSEIQKPKLTQSRAAACVFLWLVVLQKKHNECDTEKQNKLVE